MDHVDLIAILSAVLISGGGWLIQAEAEDMGTSGNTNNDQAAAVHAQH